MLEHQLEKLGFAKNEIAVYLALFELGKARAGEVIQHTKLHRNLVYQSLEKLIEKELVSKVMSKGIAVFEANSPESILYMIDEKRSMAEDVVSVLKQRQEEIPRDIKVYDGVEGIKRVRNRVLQKAIAGDEFHVIGASQYGSSSEIEQYIKRFNKELINKGVNLKILFDQSKGDELASTRGLQRNVQAKLLPFGVDIPMWVAFFRDTLDISVGKDEMATFSIRSKEAVDAFKKYFEYFWNQKVVVETGREALKKVIYEMLSELEKGEEYYVLGASAGDYDNRVQALYDEFHRDRIKKGVITRMLVYQQSFDRIKERFEKCGDLQGVLSILKKFVNAPPTPMQINLYHNRAFFIFYGYEPTIFKFEQKEIYEGFRVYFDELWNQETQILRGPEVVKNIWLESIELGEIRLIGARGYFIDRYPELFVEVKRAAEKKKGLKWKNIVDKSARNHPLNKFPWTEARYNLAGSKNPNVIWLWGNKVAVANWTEDEPVVFISENKYLVQSYNDYFEELWNLKQ